MCLSSCCHLVPFLEGGVRAAGGGDRFFIAQKGGGFPGGGRGRGAGRMSGELLGKGGGLNLFFGAETSTKLAIKNNDFLQFRAHLFA